MENRIIKLISTYLNRTISGEEFEELKKWISNSEENRAEFENVVSAYKNQIAVDFFLQNKSIDLKQKPRRRFLLWRSIAAILILGFVVSSILLTTRYVSDEVSERNVANPVKKPILLKSSENRLIVMEDGKNVEIDIIAQKGVKVTNNSMDYSEINLNDALKTPNSILTSIKIPKGKQFKIILSDGTKLWINSDTYVEYASVFVGNERRIKVIGEVFLEVAHNPEKPFIVETYNANIKVLGTKFNISAYPDDITISTTLIEGSVLFNEKTVLSPNEQLSFNKYTSKFSLHEVDVSQYVSWMDGVYQFNNISLIDLAKLFNRLYGIDVEILSDSASSKFFTGAIHTSIPYADMFKMIMKTTKINYTIDSEKITIR